MSKFELTLNIAPSDNEFKKAIGEDEWEKLKTEYIQKNAYTCQGCGFHTVNSNMLHLHIISGKIEDAKNANMTILCLACHWTQHIDWAAKQGLIKLANASISQAEIIRNGRSGAKTINDNIKNRTIILLDKNPIEYANEIKNNSLKKRKKIKAIFGKKFDWDQCKTT